MIRLNPLLKMGGLLLLITIASSCKKNTQTIAPIAVPKTSFDGVIDGRTVSLDESSMSTTYYSTDGDPVKSLLTSTTLSTAGEKFDIYINDVKTGAQTITKKLGTSSNPGFPGLRVNGVTTTPNPTQSYVRLKVNGNTWYAYAGTITISVTGNDVTVKWDLKFVSPPAREFTATGSFTCLNYVKTVQPKTAIVDPTPVTTKPTIESIVPAQGLAGDTITVTGVNYSTVLTENVFTFNDLAGKIIKATTTSLKVIVPKNGVTGAVSLKILNSDLTTGPVFTYLQVATVTSFAPAAGKIGDTVLIKGTNFSTTLADNLVKFKGIQATVFAATATQISAIVPAGAATGAITVSVKGRATITTSNFTVGNGTTWTDIGFTSPISDFNQTARLANKMIFAGGFKSSYVYLTADGTSFTNVYNALPFTKTGLEIHLLAANDSAFYVTTNYGIAKSTDGATWTKLTPNALNANLGFTGIVALGNKVSVINGNILYTSTDGGVTWTKNTITSVATLDYITSDPTGKYWYAVDLNTNNTTTTPKIFYRSTDQGKTWVGANGNTGYHFFGVGEVDFIKANSTSAFLLYAPAALSPVFTDIRLYRTTNQGDGWSKVTDEAVNAVKTNGTEVMYGGFTFNLSRDNGANFTKYVNPAGYTIYDVEKFNGYYYIFCTLTGKTTHKIFRTAIQ
ncbi:IPT/TIG domain-containing protein [Mucilaginibacter sp. UR6-11]|uniref:IPT/TIG domain-containing protein n=1 Tax=Mucilaginibacter sp. UR6-11 TaxID=1435644 RepID=UPI001E541BA0|nr:IPT/TIG domain-containing protein [Mucilaginibacter sp. UR6-11]MCC8426538.1 IPT/TIG domain-containing protein [Mucilaginibacter sp. UR6-11]